MEQHRVMLNGVTHYYDLCKCDSKKLMIVIHGGPGGNNYVFQSTVGAKLEQYYNMIYYDQRGCGRSDKPTDNDYRLPTLIQDLHELVSLYKEYEITLLGYSFGGQIALEYASLYSSHIHSVIAMNPSDFYSDAQILTQINGFYQVADEDFKRQINKITQQESNEKDVLRNIWNHATQDTVDRFLFFDPSNGEKMRKLWAEGGFENTGLMFQSLQSDESGTSMLGRLSTITVPTLIIAGADDRNCGLPLMESIIKKVQQSELSIFEYSAHFPDFEEQERFVSVVRGFLS